MSAPGLSLRSPAAGEFRAQEERVQAMWLEQLTVGLRQSRAARLRGGRSGRFGLTSRSSGPAAQVNAAQVNAAQVNAAQVNAAQVNAAQVDCDFRPSRLWLTRALRGGASCVTIGRALGRPARTVSAWSVEDGIEASDDTEFCVELAAELAVPLPTVMRLIRRLHLPTWQFKARFVVHCSDAALLREAFSDVVGPLQASRMHGVDEMCALLGCSEAQVVRLMKAGHLQLTPKRCYGAGNVRLMFDPAEVERARMDISRWRQQNEVVWAPVRPWEIEGAHLARALGVSDELPGRWGARMRQSAASQGAAPGARLARAPQAARVWAFEFPALLAWLEGRRDQANSGLRYQWASYVAAAERCALARAEELRARGQAVHPELLALERRLRARPDVGTVRLGARAA